MKLRSLLALPAVLIALAGCGSSSSSSKSATSSSSSTTAASSSSSAAASGSGGASVNGTVQVVMKNLAFNPGTIHAKVGQTVQWTNQDGPPHNVSYVSGPKFASSSTLNTGGTFSLKLTEAGTIHYFCSIHPFMKATIVVTK